MNSAIKKIFKKCAGKHNNIEIYIFCTSSSVSVFFSCYFTSFFTQITLLLENEDFKREKQPLFQAIHYNFSSDPKSSSNSTIFFFIVLCVLTFITNELVGSDENFRVVFSCCSTTKVFFLPSY